MLEYLKNRKLIFQESANLHEHLKNPRVVYCGFDPTAESLHVGHLLPLILLKKFKDNGHTIIPLVGEFTASIGDPTGKSKERNVLSKEIVHTNSLKISAQIEDILGVKTVSNNNLENLSINDFLNISRHFNVRNMINSDCFKTRLESKNGLSFLEMSYMLFQSLDFLNLHQNFNCTIQIGGSDQWANMLSGIDLIRKVTGNSTFCITCPLLLDEDGRKMGKTNGRPIWLDKNLTSDFEFFQFWRNIDDSITKNIALQFTDIELNEHDDINDLKEKIAIEITNFVRKSDKAIEERCVTCSNVIDILVELNWVKSKNEGRNLIKNKGLKIDNVLIDSFDMSLGSNFNKVISVGKKLRAKISKNT